MHHGAKNSTSVCLLGSMATASKVSSVSDLTAEGAFRVFSFNEVSSVFGTQGERQDRGRGKERAVPTGGVGRTYTYVLLTLFVTFDHECVLESVVPKGSVTDC